MGVFISGLNRLVFGRGSTPDRGRASWKRRNAQSCPDVAVVAQKHTNNTSEAKKLPVTNVLCAGSMGAAILL